MKLRTGRHNDRIVYIQIGDEPDDNDPMLATFFDAGNARAVVDCVNWSAGPGAPWWGRLSKE
jgi:hypothetical protein